jgi:hypothetical protein
MIGAIDGIHDESVEAGFAVLVIDAVVSVK